MVINDPDESVELLMASQILFLPTLAKLSEICIRTSVEFESFEDKEEAAEQAINAYQVAKYHNAGRLKEFAIDYIVKHYDNISKSSHWKQLDEESLSEIKIWRAGS